MASNEQYKASVAAYVGQSRYFHMKKIEAEFFASPKVGGDCCGGSSRKAGRARLHCYAR